MLVFTVDCGPHTYLISHTILFPIFIYPHKIDVYVLYAFAVINGMVFPLQFIKPSV